MVEYGFSFLVILVKFFGCLQGVIRDLHSS